MLDFEQYLEIQTVFQKFVDNFILKNNKTVLDNYIIRSENVITYYFFKYSIKVLPFL